MKHVILITLLMISFILGIIVSKRNDVFLLFQPKELSSNKTVELIAFDQILTKRDKINGRLVTVPGRVYADKGGNFWLVQSIGKEPYITYAIQLTAWPFKQSPPIGTWSAYVEVTGKFSRRDFNSKYDDLLGPVQIVVKEPPPGFEPYQNSPGDPFDDKRK